MIKINNIKMKLKAKDYAWCYKRMKHWQKEFGMLHYRFTMHLRHDIECGECQINIVGCTAKIGLSTENDWNNKDEIDKTIFHEVVECMIFTQLGSYMTDRSDDFLDNKTHEIVRRLENLFFK